MKKVFVIIVTYKGKQWYDECFTSLRESIVPVETIVVDNSPTDEDVEYIKAHYPEIHVIKTKENIGFGKANNLGMRYALDHGCDYVFLLNQDTWIKPDSLSIMLPIAEQHLECGIYSPMHIRADEKSIYIEIEDRGTNYANDLLSDSYFQSLKDIYLFHYVNAAAWLLPRRTLELVGGFDPIFFLYGEDDNYLHRVEYFGQWVGLIPKSQIIHDHQKSVSQKAPEYRRTQAKLVQYTNVLTPMKVNIRLAYLFRKMIVYSFFNWEKMKFYHKEFLFLWSRRKAISNSRAKNIKKGQTWL